MSSRSCPSNGTSVNDPSDGHVHWFSLATRLPLRRAINRRRWPKPMAFVGCSCHNILIVPFKAKAHVHSSCRTCPVGSSHTMIHWLHWRLFFCSRPSVDFSRISSTIARCLRRSFQSEDDPLRKDRLVQSDHVSGKLRCSVHSSESRSCHHRFQSQPSERQHRHVHVQVSSLCPILLDR